MSESQNIAILGAGVMGLSAAYTLSQAGHKITLYDPLIADEGFPADNASAMAGGMLAPYAEIEHMPPAWIEAGLAGIKLWQQWLPGHVTQNGSLLIAHEEDHYILERFMEHLRRARPKGFEPAAKVTELEPQLADRFQTGCFLPLEAHLQPHTVLPLLFGLCKIKQGEGVAFKNEAVNLETLTPAHDHIIDCRGMGAAQDDQNLRGVKGEILIVENKEFSLSRPVRLMHPRYPLYIVPRENNIFMIGATNIESADDHVTLRSGLELMSALYSLSPSFGETKVLEMKAGIRPAYPDNLPRITLERNVIRCNGLFRHGFLLAPVMAECVADHLEDRHNKYMHLFRGNKHDPDYQRSEKELHRAA